MKEFSVIAAVSLNGVIGDSVTNSIPWYLPLDLKHFRSKTQGRTVVMGTKTYRSIGRPLPNRRNVVVTRNNQLAQQLINEEGIDDCYSSFNDVVSFERAGFFIIGGEHIYGDAIRAGATNLFITVVRMNAEGDVRFPIDGQRFLDDVVHTSHRTKYVCSKRSGWFKENDIEFQFTEFRLNT